jgi:putative acetyltransferase
MISYTRTNAENKDFQELVALLDEDLRIRDGKDHAFYDQFNKIDNIKNAIIALDENIPIGCGAIKEYAADSMEVKRMYVLINRRGEGVATSILKELEKWALELGKSKCLLETGKNQPEAIRLYKKNGYHIMANYGQYINIDNSVCFEKCLVSSEQKKGG